jgi:hypothetical protein
MSVSDLIEKLGRSIFEAPFGTNVLSGDIPEMAEIRLAILDEVKAKSHCVAGKTVFPHNIVRLHILGVADEEAKPLRSEFFTQYFEEQIRASLTRAGTRHPHDLAVEVETTEEFPNPGEQWLRIEVETRAKPEAPVTERRAAKLVVMRGAATATELPLTKARVNIGRTRDVYRSDGPSRRNDLAFTEETDINRTVSREHAHILYHEESGEYRIYNDRWYKQGAKGEGNCGLWILRDGLSQEVHRNARGAKLEAGDEIHLGNAVLEFVHV